MDKRRAVILADFREFLDSAINRAGVNFATARRLSGQLQGTVGAHGAPLQPVYKSTLHDHVRGKQRQNLPPWPWVANLWAFLVAAAAENKADPDALGPLKEWQAVYEAAEAGLRRLGKQAMDAEAAVLPPTPLVEPYTAWWAAYADIVPPWFGWYLNLEPLATEVRCYEELYIPGLLQTKEYAEAVVRLQHGRAPGAQVKRRVELRMLRQRLMPHGGRRIWALINEKALQNPQIGQTAMKRQLHRLLQTPDHMPVQIVPAPVSARQSVTGPITVLRFSHADLPDTVYLEQDDSALYPADPEVRALYLQQFNSLVIAAHRPKESQAIIEQLINDM
ncbi:DUF5753 domain-containing protein [Actinomadura formosensis]|uniref:DUF5753 domain-containing protein n=1 Tax=Actinomadura formosensis TaxID=60706 RepID=UPI003D9450F7